ncbi:hypothetical protein Pelo_800 [Pelomyxa schiedti]|nr:hypothetical protein Pelo_800 [Pelomyxa schiedti]
MHFTQPRKYCSHKCIIVDEADCGCKVEAIVGNFAHRAVKPRSLWLLGEMGAENRSTLNPQHTQDTDSALQCPHSHYNSEARCSRCSGKNGEPVETTLWSLPDLTASFDVDSHSKEVISFHVTPKCSSTRSHIKSKIILLVSTIPGVEPFASNSISLCSRDRSRSRRLHKIQPLGSPERIIRPPAVMIGPQPREKNHVHVPTTAKDLVYYPASRAKRNTEVSAPQQCVEDDPRSVVLHTKSTMEFISFQTTSHRQYIAITEEHFIALINSIIALQPTYEFTLEYGKISDDLYVIGGGHKNVESFCYATEMRHKFLTGNNPFHMDITQPNPIIKFLGCANNTFFSQLQF